MINVTKTYLPKREKLDRYIDKIYETSWITNNGPFVRELERKLASYLGVKNIILVSNGTVALEIAYRVLGLQNLVITTPFSFVATTSSLVTNNLKPTFVDIDRQSLNINTESIVNSITKNTSAIVPVHVFGNACDVESIDRISKEYGLKVVYDAAHAFGVEYKGQSVLNYGDISTLSFHATKLFHTIEGGAIIINDDSLVEKARYLINFGIKNEESIPCLGVNAKMNEFQAAMGLCMLEEIDSILIKRKKIYDTYMSELSGYFSFPLQNPNSTKNYSYFPILTKNEEQVLNIQKTLAVHNIYPRRYFYPSLDTLEYISPKQNMVNSRDTSKRILCLPIYPDLRHEDQTLIIDLLKK